MGISAHCVSKGSLGTPPEKQENASRPSGHPLCAGKQMGLVADSGRGVSHVPEDRLQMRLLSQSVSNVHA